METVSLPHQPRLTEDIGADVCVIGAGFVGMVTAYLLLREGRSVVVIDDGPIGGGQTARTTAHLSNAIDHRYISIERLHGELGARLAAESHSAAIDRIESIVREEGIDCDFERVDGYLFRDRSDPPEELDEELAASCRAGLKVEKVPQAPLPFETGPCLRFPRQAQFHALKFLAGLMPSIQRHRGRIFSDAHALKIEDGNPAKVETQNGPIVSAKDVVMATHAPIKDRLAISTKQAAYITYALGAKVPKGSVGKGLYWDSLHPYHYIRTHPMRPSQEKPGAHRSGKSWSEGEELLIIGGEDHKTGQEEDPANRFDRVEAWARARFPTMGEILFRWSGQIMESVDGLAYSGRNPGDDHVYVATGDSGMGMTHGMIGATIISDLIRERENAWAGLYEPSRKTLRAMRVFTEENINVLKQYAHWLSSGDVESAEKIEPGAGAVVRRGLAKLAIFRDEGGTLHELSAVCPHLGCIVSWNAAEHTWDCPCHGSRFDRFGKVIEGPSISDLSAAKEDSVP
jgi:glycine/D-amino acid oxidase-like deaminating enzyme/nitrite reductase/ring-hydroxylating ferredoxin subunit